MAPRREEEVVQVQVRRHWADGAPILAALKGLYAYEDNRATGWLYLPDRPPFRDWPKPFWTLGPALLRRLSDDLGVVFHAVCFQAYRDGTGCGWHADRDWDEQTNRVRGLLCVDCNHGIGKFKDDPLLLNQAANYLTAKNHVDSAGDPALSITPKTPRMTCQAS